METRAVLFDLDNTLFDHLSSARAGVAAFLRYHGSEPVEGLIRAWFEIERIHYHRWIAREISFAEQRRERLRQFLAVAGVAVPRSQKNLDELFEVYLGAYEETWSAFHDVEEALRRLIDKGTIVGIITNGAHEQQTSKVRRIGLEPLLHRSLFSSERMGHAKPDPEAFLTPCRSLGLAPTQVLYVGDNYEVDILGARSAGLTAVHLDRRSQYEGGRGTIHGLSELEHLLV